MANIFLNTAAKIASFFQNRYKPKRALLNAEPFLDVRITDLDYLLITNLEIIVLFSVSALMK